MEQNYYARGPARIVKMPQRCQDLIKSGGEAIESELW